MQQTEIFRGVGDFQLRLSPQPGPHGEQGRIQDFHWVGAADPGGAVLAIERASLIGQNYLLYFAFPDTTFDLLCDRYSILCSRIGVNVFSFRVVPVS